MPEFSNILSRQAALGPPAEAPYIPFPFEELAKGIGAGVSISKKDDKKKTAEGLRTVTAYNTDLPVDDQDYIDRFNENLTAKKEELTNKFMADPKNPLFPNEISSVRRAVNQELETGGMSQVGRNKKQVEQYRDLRYKLDVKNKNPWIFLEVDRKLMQYYKDWQENPDRVPTLDLEDAMSRITPSYERTKELDGMFNKMKDKQGDFIDPETGQKIPAKDFYSSLKNAKVAYAGGDKWLVSTQRQGISDERIETLFNEFFDQPVFKADVEKQIDWLADQKELSGEEFTAENRTELQGNIKQGLLNMMKASYAGEPVKQQIKHIPEGKKGAVFNFGAGNASNKYWSFVYAKQKVSDWQAEYPFLSKKIIKQLSERSGDVLERVKIQGKSEPITITHNAAGDKIMGVPIEWQKNKGGQWTLLAGIPETDATGKANPILDKTESIPNKYAAADVQAETATADDPGMTIERFLKGAGIKETKTKITDYSPEVQTKIRNFLRKNNISSEDEAIKILQDQKRID